MLMETGVGDAYGAGFEYGPRKLVRERNDLSSYIQHLRWPELKPGLYTDDTQMSIAIAELLVEDIEWTKLNIADKFVEVFKRDPRQGYSRAFYENVLTKVNDGQEFLDVLEGKNKSDKSGGAMRAGPIGYLEDIKQLKQYAIWQARLTHDTVPGVDAAIAAALIPHYFIHKKGDKKDLGKFIASELGHSHWGDKWQGKVKAQGYMSVQAAITAITEKDSLAEILKRSVDFTGDVDTVGAIALGAASMSSEIKNDLPKHLYENLENGAFGLDYLTELDEKLQSVILK